MITIYDKNEKEFLSNGLCILNNCIRAEVTEELNSIYKLELEYPIADKKYKNIVEGNIIKAPTPNGLQLFRVFKKNKNLNSISCVCLHIFYDLLDNFIEDVRPTNSTGASAIEEIFNNTQYPNNFKALSDISKVNTAYYIRKNPVEALLSEDENSFVNRWGGEILRDNFNIEMKAHIGQDRGVTIRYGKNLVGIEEEIDESNVITRLMPTGLYENDTVLMLPEKYIDSLYINKYSHPKIKHIHYTDFKVSKEDNITEDIVIQKLRNECYKLYKEDKVDLPKINYKVDFIELSKTEEYKNYAILEHVWLGDIITVKHKELEIDLKSKVISYVYDCITNRYLEIELGNFIQNLSNSFSKQEKELNNINNKLDSININKIVDETAKILKENQGSLDYAIAEATKKITSALGGHVLKRNDELLIMDTTDINTATKVWRWNMNGLGYSNRGYNGQFETAITMDGRIVGKFLQGEIIKGVSLQGAEIVSVDNPNWENDWDITGDSNNIAKMTKGQLIFHHRSKIDNEWFGDYSTDVILDGFGLVIDQKNVQSDLYTDYGGTKTKYLAGMIHGDYVPGEKNKKGFSIDGYPSIFLCAEELDFKNEVKIFADHGIGGKEKLGKITPVKNTGFISDNTLVYLQPTDWNLLGLINKWCSTTDSTAVWCVDSTGFLHLQGRVRGGKQGSVIAKLPIQNGLSNKAKVLSFTCACASSTIGIIDIDRAGNVICRLNSKNDWISLDSITFRIEI